MTVTATLAPAGTTGAGRSWLSAGWRDVVVLTRRNLLHIRREPLQLSDVTVQPALCTLAVSDKVVAAASWYGVTDLMALAQSTHDFESRYCDRLVGPLPAASDEYRRRSPVHRAQSMRGAVLLLQGLDDPVVPPAQATEMAAALRAAGVRCEYRAFEGEGHGFRRAETLQAALEAELAFYDQVLAAPHASVVGNRVWERPW